MSRTLAVTDATGSTTSHLFYVRDTHTNTSFVVDTGSEVSVIPPTTSDRNHPILTTCCKQYTHMHVRTTLPYTQPQSPLLAWIFIITDVQKPILGTDFLTHFGLTGHTAAQTHQYTHMLTRTGYQLHFTQPLTLFQRCPFSITPPPVRVPRTYASHYSRYNVLHYIETLTKFPELTQVTIPDTPVKHILHYIDMTGPPVPACPG